MEKFVSVASAIIDNDYLYMVDTDSWDYMRAKLGTCDCEVVADITPPGAARLAWIVSICKYQTAVFFVQRNSKNIICYENGKTEFYGNFPVGKSNDWWNCDAVIWNRILYVFPCYSDGVISRFDLEKRQYLDDIPIMEVLRGNKDFPKDFSKERYLVNEYIFEENKVWFCMEHTPYIFEISVPDMDCVLVTAPGRKERLSQISKTQDDILGVWENGKGYSLFHTKENQSGTFATDESMNCTHVYKIGGKIVALSVIDRVAYVYEEAGSAGTVIDFSDISRNVREVRNSDIVFSKCLIYGDCVYLLPFSANGVVRINVIEKTADLIPCAIDRFYVQRKMYGVYTEAEDADLSEFLKRFVLEGKER
jgi:hypothetical protein